MYINSYQSCILFPAEKKQISKDANANVTGWSRAFSHALLYLSD